MARGIIPQANSLAHKLWSSPPTRPVNNPAHNRAKRNESHKHHWRAKTCRPIIVVMKPPLKSPARRKFIQTTAIAGASLTAHAFAAPVSPPVLTKKLAVPDRTLADRVLGRLTFGPCAEDYSQFASLGRDSKTQIETFVDHHLNPDSISDSNCDARLRAMNFATLGKSVEQLWRDHVIAPDRINDTEMTAKMKPNEEQKAKKTINSLRTQPALETEAATWTRAIYSRRQLNEVLTNFWHEHFNVFAYEGKVAAVFSSYDRDVIRPHILGNFREFLEAVAKSPAMLFYLDNELNQSGNPNENYARELFELHTLGAENYLGTRDRSEVLGYNKNQPLGYVDGDVYESARAFTGWRVNSGKGTPDNGLFEYFEPWHDRFQKIVLGRQLKEYQPPLKDGHDVLDALAAHPGTSRFIARKLCRRFVADNPPDSLVERIALVFRQNANQKDQLKRVVRAIFLSEEFAGSEPKIKRPFEYVAGLLRTSRADFTPTDEFLHNYERTGHRLFGWRTPDGPPDQHLKWTSAESLIERWRMVNLITQARKKELQIPDLNLPGKKLKPGEFYDLWERRIFARPLPATSRLQVTSFIDKVPNENHGRMAVAMLYMAPEYQWK